MNVPGWDVALHGLCLKPASLKKMTFLSPNLCFFFLQPAEAAIKEPS